jgi:hypothetical protein
MEKAFLSDEEVNKVILEILAGEKFYHSDILNELLLFTNPPATLKLYLEYLEESKTIQYIEEGYISENEIDEELRSQVFSTEDQEALEEVESKIKAYKILARKRIKNSKQEQVDNSKILELEVKKSELLSKKDFLSNYTAEYKAKEDKYLELLINCVMTFDKRRRWQSTEDFSNSLKELGDLYTIMNSYLEFYFGYPTKIIRKVARSNYWINYYITSMKTSTPLFSNKPEDYSLNQLHLMAWSNFYMDIREMLYKDRPSDEIVEDDERLDKYLEEYYKKFKAEVALSKNQSLNNNTDKDQHLVVTAESSDFIKLHKANVYSDPKNLSNQVGENSSSYDESAEMKKLKRKIAGL